MSVLRSGWTLEKGSATVPVALFGVSPNRWAADATHRLLPQGDCCRRVGGTPTAAVESTALPICNCSPVLRQNHPVLQGRSFPFPVPLCFSNQLWCSLAERRFRFNSRG